MYLLKIPVFKWNWTVTFSMMLLFIKDSLQQVNSRDTIIKKVVYF